LRLNTKAALSLAYTLLPPQLLEVNPPQMAPNLVLTRTIVGP
jgi:hypothetical protein